MKISILSCVFPPEPLVSARTSRDLTEELTNNGHFVRVITTFPNRPAGRLYEGFQRKLWTRERTTSQHEVLRIFSSFSSQSSMSSRFLENVSFGIASSLAILLLEKPDVIYANTWPIVAQGLLMLACQLRHIPLVLSIQDLYPESLFVQRRGIEQTSRFYELLRWVDTQIVRHCAKLIVISEQFKHTYVHERGIPEDKVTAIPNWVDDIHPVDSSSRNDIRKKHDIPEDAFLVVYGGNIGVAAGVEQLTDAFQHLKPREDIYLLIAGAGSNLPACLERIRKLNLARVKIHSPWEAADTMPVLSAADVCILPTQGEQSLVSVPSKLLSYMLAGRPILALAVPASETARIITQSQAGWVISENSSMALAGCLSEISRVSMDEREGRGQAGRSFALKHFSKAESVSKVIQILLQHGKHNEQDSVYAVS